MQHMQFHLVVSAPAHHGPHVQEFPHPVGGMSASSREPSHREHILRVARAPGRQVREPDEAMPDHEHQEPGKGDWVRVVDQPLRRQLVDVRRRCEERLLATVVPNGPEEGHFLRVGQNPTASA